MKYQRGIHMFAELGALFVFVPLLFKILLTYQLSLFDKIGVIIIIILTTIFDTFLFIDWLLNY